jgi:hypothetical protein
MIRVFGSFFQKITFPDFFVYRAGGAATRAGAAGSPPAGATRIVVPDPVLLFRYSALTGNGHRIHYDVSYATEVEHYPGLVVHGPLIATLLVGMVSAEVLAATRQIDIRARSAAYSGHALHLYDLATKLEALDRPANVAWISRSLPPARSKRFLVLFFKKELLSCCLPWSHAPSRNPAGRTTRSPVWLTRSARAGCGRPGDRARDDRPRQLRPLSNSKRIGV